GVRIRDCPLLLDQRADHACFDRRELHAAKLVIELGAGGALQQPDLPALTGELGQRRGVFGGGDVAVAELASQVEEDALEQEVDQLREQVIGQLVVAPYEGDRGGD